MGFTSGFLGGITVTSSIIYLTMAYHRQARLEQAMLLRQSSLTYRSIYEPQPNLPPPVSREVRTSIAETAKDSWNREVESLVQRAYRIDWNVVREQAEDTISSLWSKAFANVREDGEKRTRG